MWLEGCGSFKGVPLGLAGAAAAEAAPKAKLHTQGGPRRRPALARARQGRRIRSGLKERGNVSMDLENLRKQRTKDADFETVQAFSCELKVCKASPDCMVELLSNLEPHKVPRLN